MAAKQKKKRKGKTESGGSATAASSSKQKVRSQGQAQAEPTAKGDPGSMALDSNLSDGEGKSRVDLIKESHALLKQFNPKELKVLMNLKRNTSPKAWTLREDLIVLTVQMSNRQIAEVLKVRNKEAVKKRLQLLRSKGLNKRTSDQGRESK